MLSSELFPELSGCWSWFSELETLGDIYIVSIVPPPLWHGDLSNLIRSRSADADLDATSLFSAYHRQGTAIRHGRQETGMVGESNIQDWV